MRSVLRKTGTGLARGTYLELIRFFFGCAIEKGRCFFPWSFKGLTRKMPWGVFTLYRALPMAEAGWKEHSASLES